MRYKGLVIVIALLVGVAGVSAAPPAQSNLGDDVYAVTCSTGESILGGVKFTFVNVNPGFYYTVSAIGVDGFDPVIAVITSPGWGNCNDDYPELAGSQVAAPRVGFVEATTTASQVTIDTGRGGNIDVVVGGYAGSSGQFVMVVEGLFIEPASDADWFLVSVPSVVQEEEMGVYMIARSDSGVDPYVEIFYGDGLQLDPPDYSNSTSFSWCDDAGSAQCLGITDFEDNSSSFIINGYNYVSDFYDAGVVLVPQSPNRLLYVFSSSGSNTEGGYGIIIAANAPGDLGEVVSIEPEAVPVDETVECEPVDIAAAYASSEYDTRYAASALLDGNGETGWSSKSDDEAPFITLELGDFYTVSSFYFNSYPATGDQYAADAIQEFYVTIPGEEGEETTILEATAEQTSDYQYYEPEVVETDTLYIYPTSNYGGDYFEASDIVVCAE